MTFFHAEPLYKQKSAVLKQKLALLGAKKLHKGSMCVQFLNITHAHPMADYLQEPVFPLLFRVFIL